MDSYLIPICTRAGRKIKSVPAFMLPTCTEINSVEIDDGIDLLGAVELGPAQHHEVANASCCYH